MSASVVCWFRECMALRDFDPDGRSRVGIAHHSPALRRDYGPVRIASASPTEAVTLAE